MIGPFRLVTELIVIFLSVPPSLYELITLNIGFGGPSEEKNIIKWYDDKSMIAGVYDLTFCEFFSTKL